MTVASARVTSSGQSGGIKVQPTQEDPAVIRLQLGMDTPYVGGAPAESRRERELMGDTRGEDRSVGAGIMLTPSRLQSSPVGFQDPGQSSTQDLTALTQNVISGKAVHLIGAKISPEDVKKNTMAMIELKLETSKALATRPGPWRRTRYVEYFLKALEEIYAVDVVDKVDPSRTEALSVEFTAVILEKDTKHKLPEASKHGEKVGNIRS